MVAKPARSSICASNTSSRIPLGDATCQLPLCRCWCAHCPCVCSLLGLGLAQSVCGHYLCCCLFSVGAGSVSMWSLPLLLLQRCYCHATLAHCMSTPPTKQYHPTASAVPNQAKNQPLQNNQPGYPHVLILVPTARLAGSLPRCCWAHRPS
jgi:hypothetical protein